MEIKIKCVSMVHTCLSKPPPLWPQATFQRPRVGSVGEEALGTQRWGILHYIPDMEIKIKCQYGTCCLSKPPPLWPQATFHRPRVGSAGEEALGTQRWGILHYIPDMEIKIKCQYGTCCLSKPPPLWPQATFHRPRVGSAGEEALGTQRWGILHYIPDMEIKIKCQYGTCRLSKPPPLWPQATFHRPRVGSAVRKHWAHNSRGMQGNIPTIGIKFVSIAHQCEDHFSPRQPPTDPGSGQLRGAS